MDFVDETINLERYNKDCCPLHDESSPSFFYFEDSGRFHCFGCDRSGFVTDLHFYLKQREDPYYTKTKSIMELSRLYKIEIPNLFKEVSIEDKLKLPRYDKLKFKRKEDLKKPMKRVETEFENYILRVKPRLSLFDYKFLINSWDKILFKGVEIEENITFLKKEVSNRIRDGDLIEDN